MDLQLRPFLFPALTVLLAACVDGDNLQPIGNPEPVSEALADVLPNYVAESVIDISGTYVSDISSNHPWYFADPYRQPVLHLVQTGDKFVARDDLYGTHIEGRIEGDTAEFVVLPSRASGFNATVGRWKIDPGGLSLSGRWWARGHRADGQWNLRILDHEDVELFTLEAGLENPFHMSESSQFFDTIFAAPEDQNIVFYIHGRGKKVDYLFYDSMIPSVEAYSDTRFAIIHWLSWNGAGNRPYTQAMRSANGLAEFLHSLDEYKSANPDKMAGRKIILLAHSMGSIPLRVFVEDLHTRRALQPGLFDSIIINGADLPLKGHAQWVERIDFGNRIFIVQHQGDVVLYMSEHYFEHHPDWRGRRLGAGLGPEDADKTVKLAGNALYLDVTSLTGNSHRHFNLPLYQKGSKIHELFRRLLNGQKLLYPDPDIGLFERSGPVLNFYRRDPDLDFDDADR